MEIAELNALGASLEKEMKLRTHPIAVKFYEKASDVPEGTIFPKRDMGKHLAFCQATAMTRMKGMSIAMTKEDHWCWNPLIAFGCVECVPGMESFEEVIKYIGIPDHDKASKFFENFPRLPLGKYEAVALAPLEKAKFEPDVVVVYGNTAQVNIMVRTVKGLEGDYIRAVFDGIDSCIYATVTPFLSGKYHLTFPDPGDRERARAGDDEAIISVPGAKIADFVHAIENNGLFGGYSQALFDFPLDFMRPPFYHKLFDMWGLDKDQG